VTDEEAWKEAGDLVQVLLAIVPPIPRAAFDAAYARFDTLRREHEAVGPLFESFYHLELATEGGTLRTLT